MATKQKRKKISFDKIIILIMFFCSIYFIYSLLLLGPIEKLLRFGLVIAICIIDFLFLKQLSRKKRKKNLISFIGLFLILFYLMIGVNIQKVYNILNSVNKEYVTHSTSLVTLKDNNSKINNIKKRKIGLLKDTSSEDGYILPYQILNENNLIKENEIIEYDDYIALASALYQKKVDFIFLPSNYSEFLSTTEGFEDIQEKTKVLISQEKEKEKELLGNAKSIEEPFTILLMGIDSSKNGLGNADSFNGDSLILITFNPDTLNATMLSIPRDTYVPISCFNGKIENKITHAASKGTKCVIDTIQDFTGITIDYYMKINFTGLVDLVNELKGITVDVPYSFCEQDSKRRFGSHMIYVKKGVQTLNGEQALALSRNRKSNSNYCSSEWTKGLRNDFVRGNNQQLVIKALLQKIKEINSVNEVYDILKILSDNMDTNMSTETLLSFYNVAKDILARSRVSTTPITIEQLFLQGDGQTIYDERTNLQLWNYIPNKNSLNDIVNAMKVNLNLKSTSLIKDFHYSIDENYKKTIIGEGPYNNNSLYELLPDFTSYSLVSAQAWALEHNITLKYEYVNSTSNNVILKQDYPVNKRLDKIENKTVTLTITKIGTTSSNDSETTPETDTNKEEDANNQ